MKKTYIWALLCLAVPLSADATVIEYLDDNQMFARADVIVDAKVWRHTLVPGAIETTQYEIEALECFKGCEKGQFLVMTSLGTSPTRPELGPHEQVAGAPHPEDGERVIVYLSKFDGTHHLIGLGFGMYRVHFNPSLKRFIARRQTDSVFIMKPTSKVARAAENQVLVPTDTFANELVDKLRAQKAR